MKATTQDLSMTSLLSPYTSPDAIPVTYTIGDRVYRGIPSAWEPTVARRMLNPYAELITVTANTPEGLTVEAECTQYNDYPVVEWVVYIQNDTDSNSPVISDWHIITPIAGQSPTLYHGNGDTCTPDGYEWWTDPVTPQGIDMQPCGDGTSCNGAFPYMRLNFEGFGVNIAVGWSGTWRLRATATDDGATLTVGQASFASYLKPGERVRTPRLTLQGFVGGDGRGRNLWRSFYIDHVLPKEDGHPLSPKLILHTWMIDGLPEFCGVTEENQLAAIDTYLAGGLKPDIWWIDAGWYPCNNDWPYTGNWYPNPEHFPHGMGKVGQKCADEDIDLLVWFEPERVRRGTDLWKQHPEFLLFYTADDNPWLAENALLDLGNPTACDWLIDKIDRLIKESGITVYRQDFNFSPAPYWTLNTPPNREGILENLHIQGYYRYWDTLIQRNPGLWMDSCASGGRRNDYETMRRGVPLHYTDVGYGHHPIKQKQHRQMFEWIPYFRAHNYNWDLPDGTYGATHSGVDEFGYQNALTPALTSMIEYYHPHEVYAVGHRFHPVWRRAAGMELSCDYYPLTECRKDASDIYAMQFDGEDEGFIQIIRNVQAEQGDITLTNLHIDPSKTYVFTDELNGRTFTASGRSIAEEGFSDSLPPRSGVIWFYQKI